MKIVFTSYINVASFNDPKQWLERIKGYVGILEALSKQHAVISIEQINYTGEFEQNGVKYYFLNFKKKKLLFPFSLHNFIKKLNPDIVLVHGMHFPLQVIQLKQALGNKTKIIIQNHAEQPFNLPKNLLQKLADKYISAYMFTSTEMAKEWIDKKIIADEKKIWGITETSSAFSPIDKLLAKNKTKITGAPVFLFVGRLDDNKDPIKVVRSFLRYNQQQTFSKLYMLYHTKELLDKIQEIISKAKNKDAIILVGKVSHDEMPYWYSNADFIISASHYEAGGTAVCEGMSCGCIPILTSIAPFKKVTANGACGILYDVHEEDALFNALMKTQHINIEEEKKKVLAQFKSDLSFDAIAKQISEKISAL
jgi:glycosyltransferase involved in cell wall biosynthesis